MKPVDRQKMCPNCDGRIPYDATQCPYCFTQQQSDNSSPKSFSSPSDPISGLYPPPYPSRPSSDPLEAKPIQKASFPEGTMALESPQEVETVSFWSILMLTLGGNLLTLGLLQIFFSNHGILQLEINASYWFLMVLVALPLTYFGFKSLSSKK